MYRISVPIMLNNLDRGDRDEVLKMLHSLGAERVFLALDPYELDIKKREKTFADLKRHTAFFKAQGFEVGAWTLTFVVQGTTDFTYMVAVSEEEQVLEGACCPTDESFLEFSSDYIANMARCGVDLIMLDDDFRYAFLAGNQMGCLCHNHMRMIEEMVGETLPRKELAKRILSGGKNKYRDAWLSCNGRSFEVFARRLREKVDTVDPKVRLGVCACLGSWDLDGTDARKLSYILAGHTKPFIRLIGAPYWAATNSKGCFLQDVIELERMESTWTRDGDIEIMAEGDTYPRPRISCPASYLEGFDLAMRASGATDGILKYAIDYVSGAKYEQGYVAFHEMNTPLYSLVDDFFSNKSAKGVRIYEFPKKISDMDVGAAVSDASTFQNAFFCTSERSLAACSIPTTYEGEGVCGACFGQSARYLTPDMRKNGLILDAEAAKILHTLGIDVGIESLGVPRSTTVEHFLDDGEAVVTCGTKVFDHKFKDAIRVCSNAESSIGSMALSHMRSDSFTLIPMSYLYENEAGERYFVINFDTRYVTKTDNTLSMRHYQRSKQYAQFIPWLSRGKQLPAYCFGHPHLYLMTKEKDGVMAVGLWNFFADLIVEPVIELDREYREIRFLNCHGKLQGKTVMLTNIAAHGFAAFEVK